MPRVNGLYMNDRATKQELGALIKDMAERDKPVDFREDYDSLSALSAASNTLHKINIRQGKRQARISEMGAL